MRSSLENQLTMKKKKPDKTIKRCWEFFHCSAQKQKTCLLSETNEWRCWLVNIACCRMNTDTPMPLSVKKSFCKTCEYYKEYAEKKQGEQK